MQDLKAVYSVDKDTISLFDIIQCIKSSYKKILLLGLSGLFVAILFTYALGQHTASITLLNYAKMDIPRIRYLQSVLPRLIQEGSAKGYAINLGSDGLWQSAIKIKNLIGKSDAKDLLDPSSLKSDRYNVYAIDILGKANAKQLAEERAQEISSYFIKGTIFIDLRDLICR